MLLLSHHVTSFSPSTNYRPSLAYTGISGRTPVIMKAEANPEASQEDELNGDIEDLKLERSTSPIRVIYESENILVIDKPPHIAHHDDQTSMGIMSCVRELQKEKQIAYQGRIYGVHRLDRVTSGILIFAKSNEVAGALVQSFKEKTVTKYYVALTNKKAKKKKQGWVRGDMVPSRRGTWKLTDGEKKENPAVTRFFTAGLGNCDFSSWTWASNDDSKSDDTTGGDSKLLPKTMMLFRPHTGKTHQLRVAAKSVGMSILGDETYSDAVESKCMERAYLHAVGLQVEVNGENVAIYNPPTSWFVTADNDESGESNGMEDALTSLMTKHCDNAEILQLIK